MRVIDAYRVGKHFHRNQTRRYENVAKKRPDAIDLNKPHFRSSLAKKSESYPVYKNQEKPSFLPFRQQHGRGEVRPALEQVPAQQNPQNPTLKKALLVYQRQMGVGQPSKMLEAFLAKGVTPGLVVGQKSSVIQHTQKRKETQKKELWKTYDRKNMVYVDDDQVATKVIGYKTGELVSVMI